MTIAKLKHHFMDVFKPQLGCCTKVKATLYLKTDAHLVFLKKRPVPYAFVPLLDPEIDHLVAQNFISAVDHSQRAAPIVVVRKANGSIRLRANFSTGLNDALTEHNPKLEPLFPRISAYGFRVRIDKCHIVVTQLTYLGNVITAARRRSDPKKVDAIIQMPKPKDTAQVRSFLGLINYYGAFVPKMRRLRLPLDPLLEEETTFN
ncbi:hypothetical protein TELCIR_05515 [Teladorsagia circumcincta]|uniref:Reverse transcriptase domain-containing protein n=1 Tax=Teladorsagia circumcincta TaxID=45464 RepID=A0A2G9USQ6_TELCI|nr:hypothetical protein TELCIR_05515 [Teladorsagia circumcincta]